MTTLNIIQDTLAQLAQLPNKTKKQLISLLTVQTFSAEKDISEQKIYRHLP